jgi:ABC-type lipoprotein release transport system permease subunit
MHTHRRRARVTGRVVACALFGILAVSTLFAQEAQLPSILVARQLAALEGIEIGDEVELTSGEPGGDIRRFRVIDTYEPTPDPMQLGVASRGVRMHLTDLLALTRDAATPTGTEHVEGINIALQDPEDAREFADDVNARVVGAYALLAEQAAGAGNTFVVLERFHMAIATVTIVAATVFLLALTVMLVEERRATVGVLRLIGFPARRILVQVLIEGVLLAGVGALFGLVLAVVSEDLINRFFQWQYDTALVFVHVTPTVAATCLAIAVPLGAVATVVASWALLRSGGLRLAKR